MGGHCRWKVWCKEQQTSAGMILVIAKIVSSDAAFPWKILFCSHENDRGPGGTDPKGDPFSPGKPRGQRPTDRKRLSFVYLDTGDSPGGAYVRRAVQTYELNARFSALAASPIERVEATAGVSRSRKRGNKHRPASTLSAQKPGAGEHKSQGLNTSGENTQTEDAQPYSPAEVLRRTLDVVESMAEANCSVRDKVVTVKAASHNDHLFNIPDLNGVRERRWLYLDDERKQQRPIYLAEIEFDRRYLYLLEVVRKAGDAYSMLLFSAPEYEVLSDAHLLSVIGACIGAERVTRLRIEGLKLNFWTFAHRFSVTAGLMAKRVLDATGLMGSEVGEHARA